MNTLPPIHPYRFDRARAHGGPLSGNDGHSSFVFHAIQAFIPVRGCL